MDSPAITGRQPGLAQLSLVEHALCPLDADLSIHGAQMHESHYGYTDADGNRRHAQVRVTYPNGLSPNDELYLWGLIGLTFSQPTVAGELHATPHFCLRQFGLIDQFRHRGGKDYKQFRAALGRLAGVTYFNTGFYDPIRAEHRDRSFGFLKYDLPLNANSNRAWRIVWDPLFFEFCQATGGRLFFDLPTYRQFDCATRRLFLFLHKLFWRRSVSPLLDVRYLSHQVMGLNERIIMRNLKQKLSRCLAKLLDHQVIAFPIGINRPADLFLKKAKGCYSLRLQRGSYFDRAHNSAQVDLTDSPLYEQLKSIGFEPPAIRRILAEYRPDLITTWIDITLAAKERKGPDFFTTSPQAFFVDNIREAANGRRSPPDWWRAEKRRRSQVETPDDTDTAEEDAFRAYLQGEARQNFERAIDFIFNDLRRAGSTEPKGREHAVFIAKMNLRAHFRRQRRAS